MAASPPTNLVADRHSGVGGCRAVDGGDGDRVGETSDGDLGPGDGRGEEVLEGSLRLVSCDRRGSEGDSQCHEQPRELVGVVRGPQEPDGARRIDPTAETEHRGHRSAAVRSDTAAGGAGEAGVERGGYRADEADLAPSARGQLVERAISVHAETLDDRVDLGGIWPGPDGAEVVDGPIDRCGSPPRPGPLPPGWTRLPPGGSSLGGCNGTKVGWCW